MRPKFFGVTSSSISSLSWASGLNRLADSRAISSCLLTTFSTTINLANARMSPSFRSISHRSSRAGPTARLAAESRASSTALIRISRSSPFSRSQYSMLAKNSAFIVCYFDKALAVRNEQKSRKIAPGLHSCVTLSCQIAARRRQPAQSLVGSPENRQAERRKNHWAKMASIRQFSWWIKVSQLIRNE